jgi:hypothetical protein
MQEFPYAWWYKCIALHSAKISSKDEGVHCSEWSIGELVDLKSGRLLRKVWETSPDFS